MDMSSDKAPGPDGFTALFFKKCWPLICFDIMRAVATMECRVSRNLHLLNSANMILLPKTPDAVHPSEFRPISLVHFFGKLITKILALRLRPRMHELVSPCQSAFIKKRAIHDNFIFVRAQARLFRQKKMPALLLKLDLQKAFDSISWEFLLEVLEAKGFGQKWRDWIACLLFTASTSIIVNGELTDPISHKRGLRQGDPLSPLLFVIATDILAELLAMADRVGALKSNRFLQPKNRVSMYADDIVIFTEADEDELVAVKSLLHCFGEASGLLTNYAKSAIIPIHCGHIDISSLSAILQCTVKSFPCTYLGLPLSDQRLRKGDMQPALDRLSGKVKGWNKGNFSLEARLLLVKHVLSAMHIYQLLVIDPPIWLIKAIDKIRRGFLWNNDELTSGGKCLVNWAAICRPLEFGGLGITDLQRKAMALRVRWLWHSWTVTDKAWTGMPLGIDERARSLFNAAVLFKLGDGQKIDFWRDPWLDGQSIAARAPNLFKFSTKRSMSVALALTDGKWTRHFKRGLTPEALSQYLLIHDKLASIQLQVGIPDTVVWRLTGDGQYSAISAYAIQFEGAVRRPFKDIIWSCEAPLKCRIFSWLAILGKCHTSDCLMKKGWPHNVACVMCLSEPETALHLLASCSVTIRLWRKILNTAGLPASLAPSISTSSLQDWFLSSTQAQPQEWRKHWLNLVQLTCWTIWKERNSRIFQNSAAPLNRVHANIIDEARNWRDAGRTKAHDLLHRPREPD
jgi:hypothetical protein